MARLSCRAHAGCKYVPCRTKNIPEAPKTPQSSSNRTAATPPADGAGQASPLKGVVAMQLKKLMSSCCVLRVNDFCVYRVSTPKRKQSPKEFISGNSPDGHLTTVHVLQSTVLLGKEYLRCIVHWVTCFGSLCRDKGRFKLPTQVASVHLEFTVFYYPAASDFPVPPPKLYVQLNPIQVTFDPLSILWLNSFGRSLQRAIVTEPPPPPSYLDVHLEAVMPKVRTISD
ncbi:UHRF1-binding protein 1-like [Chionoecetes opilio]|uniref:UHRF1-binding protein 1-like n=1 Tax=Chionoecetes opilio TaxID=41210 RepID=A0A8J8WNI6_CHIOP|nr:UHRF1-binding protein 1-like [Chionoecetes opilio]